MNPKESMKRIALLAALSIIAAVDAQAASLSISADATSYAVGDKVTLTIVGDAQGVAAESAEATVVFDSNVFSLSAVSQGGQTSFDGGLVWAPSALATGADFATVISIIAGLSPFVPDHSFVSTLELVVEAVPESLSSTFGFEQSGTRALNFFGLTDPAGTTITIVPEPTTAALFAAGLLGLVISGRRR